MDMPEGWKKMKTCSEIVKSFKMLPPHEGEISIQTAVNLMKEMAEALELYRQADTIQTHSGFMFQKSPATEALKKFKEWK